MRPFAGLRWRVIIPACRAPLLPSNLLSQLQSLRAVSGLSFPNWEAGAPCRSRTSCSSFYFLAGLADWLTLWENTGLSLALLVAAISTVVTVLGRRDWPVLAFAIVAPLLLAVEVTALSVTLAFFALSLSAMLAAGRGPGSVSSVLPVLIRSWHGRHFACSLTAGEAHASPVAARWW